MQSLADRVILASGWTRRLIALLAGACGALAMAPVDFGPALTLPMIVAVWLLDGSSEARSTGGTRWIGWGSLRLAFNAGWWLGFGYFLAGLWWIGAAFLVDPEFAWALPLGVVGLPALLAFFPAFGFVAARLLWCPGAARIVALAIGLGLSEWLRGSILTGFPWNALGMALGGTLVTAQSGAIVGLDGLTILAILLFAAPATLIDGDGARLSWTPTLAAIGTAALLVALGAARLAQPPPANVPHVVVRIMQPGLRPDEKFSPANKDEILARYFGLSRQDDPARGVKLDNVTLLVWPESAFPFILTRDAQALAAIGDLLPAHAVLATGAAREEDVPATRTDPAHADYYNSIELIGHGGALLGSYDKVHLVPFGEYLPFDGLLRRLGLRNFVDVPGGFEPGTRRRTLLIPGLPPAAPLICYEAIFPGAVLPEQRDGPRPALLLNVTNDGWFGLTAGPHQHLAQARLRSIEQGLPMIRAAATGISAMIDPYGRIVGSLALGREGILDAPLSKPIGETVFARYHGVVRPVLGVFMVLALMGLRLRRRFRLGRTHPTS